MNIDPHVIDWLNLLLRWLHIVTGIAWIGSSFYFNWLDMSLTPPPSTAAKGVFGELWAVHGGGFYHVQKYLVSPEKLPSTLHWFKWESYFTWISGFSLFIVTYYFSAQTSMIDPSVADIKPWQAILISVSALIGGWFFYDLLCKSPIGKSPTAIYLGIFGFLTAAAYGLNQVFSSKAAYIQVGAMIGTMMTLNVFRVIIPGQKRLVKALTSGQTPNMADGKNGKARSQHNNYFTLPILFIMISNHYAFTYGMSYNWAILAAIALCATAIRHFFNLRNKGHLNKWILPVAALGLISLAIVTKPGMFDAKKSLNGSVADIPVEFKTVKAIIDKHCVACHSANPDPSSGFTTAPLGTMYDTAQQIANVAQKIKTRAVTTSTMPLGNKTGMTVEERQTLGAWIDQGAKIK